MTRKNDLKDPYARNRVHVAQVLESIFKSTGVTKKLFTMCLADWGGKLTVGGINTTLHHTPSEAKTSITWMPMQLAQSCGGTASGRAEAPEVLRREP